ncbi:MAG: heparan-alpha-glucosaminide N-acetyltransferase domain-containing protein [Candidatus Acidiferrales bacterium]
MNNSSTSRVLSLDFVRGIAMILMAIDHVRVYSGLPAGGPTPGIFFTRWITHFVAPAFVFLAGTSIFLHGRKLPNRAALSKFLLVRGVWLILLELTVLRIAWTFNFDFAHYLLAGVIWMIGWCMIIMAGLVFLPISVNATVGVAIIALHNLTGLFSGPLERAFGTDGPNWFLNLLYFGTGGELKIGHAGPPLVILYVIVPWIGVMMAGYAFGSVMKMEPNRRRAFCLKLGAALTVLFILLRAANLYGDPRPWRSPPPVPAVAIQTSGAPAPAPQFARPAMPAALSFLNTTKYPASLLFLLMTLGPMFLVLGLAENWRGSVAQIAVTYGRVPMFYYLLHIPLIHLAACVVSLIREGHINSWLFANHPMAAGPAPAGYTWSLGLLYAVYAICVALLYFPCRWYAQLRATRKSKWLSYL